MGLRLRRYAGLLCCLLAGTLVACQRDRSARDEAASKDSRDAKGSASNGQPANPAGDALPLSDPAIFALIDVINVTDSAAGTLAASRGASAAIRDLGKRVARDHHLLRVESQRVAQRLTLVPQLPPGDTTGQSTQRLILKLSAMPRGRDFDKAYVDHQVGAHLGSLELATRSLQAAQSAELKFLLQKVLPILQDHYDRTKEAQQLFR